MLSREIFSITSKCSLSGPMHILCISSLFKHSLNSSSSSRVNLPCSRLFLKNGFPGKNWGKEGTEYLGHLHSTGHQFPHHIQQRAHFCPNLSFDVYGLVESFLVVLHIPCQTQLQVSVGFSNSVSARSARLHAPLGMPTPASTRCTLVCHSHIPDENTSANMERSNKILHSSPARCRTDCAEYVTFPVPMDLVWFSLLATVISFCLRMQHPLCIHVKYWGTVFHSHLPGSELN